MAVTSNTTTTNQITTTVKEIDFATRFEATWEALREIMGVSRFIRKAPGTKLSAGNATVVLQDGNVAEGDEIPLSQATVTPVEFSELKFEKYRKRVTIEAVDKYGAKVASQMTDDALLGEITGKILDKFYTFAGTGTLKGDGSYASFQMALAMAIGLVKDQFKKLHRAYGNIVAFVNTLDVAEYLGGAEISVQNKYGVEYLKDFLGANTVIITSEVARGTVIATPAENINCYYADPADSDFAELGLEYTTSNAPVSLIGVHKEGVYGRASGDTHAIVAMELFAELLNGIAVVSFTVA